MSSLRGDATNENGSAGPDIRIDTEVIAQLSWQARSSEDTPRICRWLDCWRD